MGLTRLKDKATGRFIGLDDNPLERFASHVQVSGDHWIWTGSKTDRGHGAFSLHGRMVRAHRYAWTVQVDKIPKNYRLHNTCGYSYCVNPKHWTLGYESKPRQKRKYTPTYQCINGHPYTKGSYMVYKTKAGRSYRKCILCRKASSKRYEERKKLRISEVLNA